MPEYTDEQIADLKRNAGKAILDNLIKATGFDSEESMVHGLKLVKEKNPLELEKKLLSVESALASERVSKGVALASHKSGFKDPSYAEFIYSKRLSETPEAERSKLTPESFIESLKGDESMKHHFFGRNKANSNGAGGKVDPENSSDTGVKSVLDFKSPQELSDHISQLGFSPRI